MACNLSASPIMAPTAHQTFEERELLFELPLPSFFPFFFPFIIRFFREFFFIFVEPEMLICGPIKPFESLYVILSHTNKLDLTRLTWMTEIKRQRQDTRQISWLDCAEGQMCVCGYFTTVWW